MLLHSFNFSNCVCRKSNARITLEKLAKQCAGLCLASGDCFAVGGVLLLPILMLVCSTAGRSYTIAVLPHVQMNVGHRTEEYHMRRVYYRGAVSHFCGGRGRGEVIWEEF